jgi:hypothetical protein
MVWACGPLRDAVRVWRALSGLKIPGFSSQAGPETGSERPSHHSSLPWWLYNPTPHAWPVQPCYSGSFFSDVSRSLLLLPTVLAGFMAQRTEKTTPRRHVAQESGAEISTGVKYIISNEIPVPVLVVWLLVALAPRFHLVQVTTFTLTDTPGMGAWVACQPCAQRNSVQQHCIPVASCTV